MNRFIHILLVVFISIFALKFMSEGSEMKPANPDSPTVLGSIKEMIENLAERMGLTLTAKKVETAEVQYKDPVDNTVLTGKFAYFSNSAGGKSPGVLIVHDWDGRDDFEDGKAEALAKLGYVAFALDVYGARGGTRDRNLQLMTPLTQDRTVLLRRLQAGLDQLKKHAGVNSDKIGGIGFCFGGLAVLDMARAGLPLKGVVTFHGGLKPPPESFPRAPITSKILVTHGHVDSSIKPDQVLAFETEMTDRGANWQVHIYGNDTNHAFTRPGARYNSDADRRSWQAMKYFFNEVFDEI